MRKTIDPALSIYFDLARIVAAIVVVLHHLWPLIFPSFPLPWPGHEAVVVFFVLSGYVIAYTASDPTIELRTYTLHRATRVLSVAIPALLLSVVVVPFADGPAIQYAGPMEIDAGQFLFATLINVVFLGQSFGMNEAPPFNEPFWSICYEVWYYVIFATWMYSSKRWRVALTVLALALAGLKIIALLPVWLLGVWLYHKMPYMTERRAVILFSLSVVAAFAFYWSGASQVIRGLLKVVSPEFMDGMKGSNQFVGDLILGLCVTANFAAVASLGSKAQLLARWEKRIRGASSYTLSTYLYHMPLAVLIWNGLGVHNAAAFAILLIAFIVILGKLTERRVKFFRNVFEKIYAQPSLWRAARQAP